MVFKKCTGAHFKGGETYYSPLVDAIADHIDRFRYNMWLYSNRKEIHRYGEYTVAQAQKNGITPFEQYYGGGEVKTMND